MSGVYLKERDGKLVEMRETPFEKEENFQELLAEHPNLLAGDQINSSEPRRWLLVTREVEIPDEEGGSGRWSLDHLFLDQDGIPTFVEVKRSSDTRLRREVVGQMLDYAANAVSYWPENSIRTEFEARCKKQGTSPSQELSQIDVDCGEEDAFWEKVKVNIQDRCIRMLFVADAVPRELRSIVEFLNDQMQRPEVLALEIKQYANAGLRILVPRIIEQSAKKTIAQAQRRPWTKKRLLAAVREHRARKDHLPWVEELIEFAEKGAAEGLFTLHWNDAPFEGGATIKKKNSRIISITCDGRVSLEMKHWRDPSEEQNQEAVRHVNSILGMSVKYDPKRYPDISDHLHGNPEGREKFKEWLRDFASLIGRQSG